MHWPSGSVVRDILHCPRLHYNWNGKPRGLEWVLLHSHTTVTVAFETGLVSATILYIRNWVKNHTILLYIHRYTSLSKCVFVSGNITIWRVQLVFHHTIDIIIIVIISFVFFFRAIRINCTNALNQDRTGRYRLASLTQAKHHWWWKANRIFNELNAVKNYTGALNT